MERHNEILRVQLHKVQSRLRAENLTVRFPLVLAEATLAKNCLLSTGNSSTPYQSLYGRVPQVLPQIDDTVGAARLDDEMEVNGSHSVHRLREISVASSVKQMAQRRLKIAAKSRLQSEVAWGSIQLE